MASSLFSRSLIESAGLSERSTFDYAALTRILKAVEARLAPLESQSGSLDAAIEAVRKVGLDRINEVLVPAIQLILDIQSKGYLVANSSSSVTIANGNILTLVIDDVDQRRLFTPSPFVALTRAATPDDYAILRTVAYTAQDGKYYGEVLSFEGSAGPHNDWVLGALAGSTIAGLSSLNQTIAARDAAVAAKTSAQSARDAASGYAATTLDAKDSAATSAAYAGQKAQEAAASALAAATFNPSSYYNKSQTDSAISTAVSAEASARTDAVAAEAAARASAITAIVLSPAEALIAAADTSLVSGKAYRITASGTTLTLPASPAVGAAIRLIDSVPLSSTTTATLGRNGKTIMGLAENMTLDTTGLEFVVWWNGSDWRLQ